MRKVFVVKSILDHGYVRLVNNMGSELNIVNAARVSFEKESKEFSSQDLRLLEFLIEYRHDSCFRHNVMTFEIYAPLMVARQWYKHTIGSTHLDEQLGWNESSRRYITENEQFYIPSPDQWRSTPANKKQGSAEPVSRDIGVKYTQNILRLVESQERIYQEALADGIAPEQARLLLPAYGMYVRWQWTASLNAVLHFLTLRLKEDAQYEIREYAQGIYELIHETYPNTIEFWYKHRV